MKGLLLKDTYLILKWCKSIFFLDIFFLLLFLLGDGNLFFISYPCMTSVILSQTLLSCDEREKWSEYAAMLPYSRGQIVSSKYLITLLYSVFILFLSALVQVFYALGNRSFLLGEYLGIVGILSVLCLAPPAVFFPLYFRLGSEKGRIVYFLMIGVICGGSVFLSNQEPAFFAGWSSMSLTFLFLGAALFYIGSWFLSIYFYEKREL